ncbi:hypothetical protein [Xanthomonas phage JGB6]|nr:hypothetical protein [Xanthomonas phage JGB6]
MIATRVAALKAKEAELMLLAVDQAAKFKKMNESFMEARKKITEEMEDKKYEFASKLGESKAKQDELVQVEIALKDLMVSKTTTKARFNRAIDTKETKVKNIVDELRADQAIIPIVLRSISAAAKQITDAAARVETLEKVAHVLGRKGFRGEVLDQVTPYLNARTASYLSALTDGMIEATWEP